MQIGIHLDINGVSNAASLSDPAIQAAVAAAGRAAAESLNADPDFHDRIEAGDVDGRFTTETTVPISAGDFAPAPGPGTTTP